jgi:hypothetical protein
MSSGFKKLQGIVSRHFEVPLDSSDIATPKGTGSFFKNKVDFVSNFFYFLGRGTGSLPCEQISALGAAAAHSTHTPQLIFVIVFIAHT